MKNNTYYVGSTKDLKRRLSQHNSGNVLSTKYKKPYELVFYQEFSNIQIAKEVEYKIKNWKRRDFIEKIIKEGKIKFIEN